eukprot:01014.XXX_2607_2934_1 [CDS] Oithona nana genome sequencing.
MTMGLNSTVGPSQDPIVDLNDDVPSSASFWQQLKATVIRNYYRKLRNKRQAFRETFTPCYYLILVIVMKLAIPSPTYPAVTEPF